MQFPKPCLHILISSRPAKPQAAGGATAGGAAGRAPPCGRVGLSATSPRSPAAPSGLSAAIPRATAGPPHSLRTDRDVRYKSSIA
jgi:hypothetical protein